MSNRSELAEILRRLADYIDTHPDESLKPILQDAVRLTRKNQSPEQKKPLDVEEANRIAALLREIPSREEGLALLQARISNRRTLEAMARFFNLPVQRDDTVERLREKIVENTIGARLRSEAIQGNR
jgi:hypothetical protein